MRINRICKICGKPFVAIKSTQFFCCRKCFKRSYYLETKIKLLEKKQNPKYPRKKCDFCGEYSDLDFDPTKDIQRFDNWRCPHCGVSNEIMWKYQTKTDSYQIISNFIVSIGQQIDINIETKYEVYCLPVRRPEQGNPSIVVMTCDNHMNILDIQKKNRKKILFS
jgi:hypothetical protein